MSDKEFREKIRALGYPDEYADEILNDRNEMAKIDIKMPLGGFLIELPTDYPTGDK